MRLHHHPFPVPGYRHLSTLFALVLICVAGCHVGSADPGGTEPPPNNPPVDSGSGGDDDGEEPPPEDGGGGGAVGGVVADGDGVVSSAPTDCENFEEGVTNDGHHPPFYDFTAAAGQGCTGTCHKGGNPLEPPWTASGAVYDGFGEDSQPVAGARIYVTDSAGKIVRMTTATNGFFFTTEPLAAGTLTTFATGCPSRPPMASPAPANCNAGGTCHLTTFRIHVP